MSIPTILNLPTWAYCIARKKTFELKRILPINIKTPLVKLRLVLDVDIDPQGINTSYLKTNLNRVVWHAVNNGTLTGDTPATVELYKYKVTVRRNKRPKAPIHYGKKSA